MVALIPHNCLGHKVMHLGGFHHVEGHPEENRWQLHHIFHKAFSLGKLRREQLKILFNKSDLIKNIFYELLFFDSYQVLLEDQKPDQPLPFQQLSTKESACHQMLNVS